MHSDSFMLALVAAVLGILLVGMASQRLKQPHVVGYLLAGVMLGPDGFALVTAPGIPERMGEIGVMLLLFFVGLEATPRQLFAHWRIALFGPLLQSAAALLLIWPLGLWLGWSLTQVLLFSFIITLSSTAVVLKTLADSGELDSRLGRRLVGILLIQDLAIVPMLIILRYGAGTELQGFDPLLTLVGGVLLVLLLGWLYVRPRIEVPLPGWIRTDPEMQVFAALSFALGLALLTGLLNLSTALGAFVAGMLIGASRDADWVHRHLEPFRVVFVAAFFVSIGMLVDLDRLLEHLGQILLLVLALLGVNTSINALLFRLFGDTVKQSLYAGALLAQAGEFSFVLAAFGREQQIIDESNYQLAVAVIALSLLLSPLWVQLIRRYTDPL